MEKSKYYNNVRFASEVIQEAHNEFIEIARKYNNKEVNETPIPQNLEIGMKNERWRFDHTEEFLAMANDAENYNFDHIIGNNRIIVGRDTYSKNNCRDRVVIRFPDKFNIEKVFNIFEKNVKQYSIKVEQSPFKIFIGHGRDKQWKDLKDHLTDQHGFEIICYEIGATAGITIKDKLEYMLYDCSFALLIFTGEDIDIDGELHARENVIHELGLFQGALGFDKAIILIEDKVKEFTNIVGLNQIRFAKGNIKEIFGDVVATLNNELKINVKG